MHLETDGRDLGDFEEKLRDVATSFAERLSLAPGEIDTIYIVATYSRSEFERATHGAVPDWGIGAALPDKGQVVLLFTESSRSPVAAELIMHELGHIFLHRAVGDVPVPRWFDEGFAQWVSGPMDFGQTVRLSWANMLGETIPLRELEDINSWDTNRAQLAYAESQAAFQYLVGILPNGRPEPLISEIGRVGDFEEGFYNVTGMTIPEFYRLWAKESVRRYNWLLLLADWRILFSIMALLFVILGTIKLLNIRKRQAEPQNEEI